MHTVIIRSLYETVMEGADFGRVRGDELAVSGEGITPGNALALLEHNVRGLDTELLINSCGHY